MKLVYIEWFDHCSLTGGVWHEKSDVENMAPMLVKSVGWVVKETDKYVIIVSSMFSDVHVGGDVLIIKSCIKSKKVIKL